MIDYCPTSPDIELSGVLLIRSLSRLSNEVLPDPLGPIIAMISPLNAIPLILLVIDLV